MGIIKYIERKIWKDQDVLDQLLESVEKRQINDLQTSIQSLGSVFRFNTNGFNFKIVWLSQYKEGSLTLGNKKLDVSHRSLAKLMSKLLNYNIEVDEEEIEHFRVDHHLK